MSKNLKSFDFEPASYCETCKMETFDSKEHSDAGHKINYDYKDMFCGMQILKAMADELNRTNAQIFARGMFREMQRTHRYLQAEVIIAIREFIKLYAESDSYDDRNKWAIEFCKTIADRMP